MQARLGDRGSNESHRDWACDDLPEQSHCYLASDFPVICEFDATCTVRRACSQLLGVMCDMRATLI